VVEIAVGGADDADIDFSRLVAADAFKLAFLQHAQQFGLQGQGQFADLVQKDGTEMRVFKTSGFGAVGPGKGSFFVAEEFGFEQVFGNGRAVDLDEGVGLAVGEFMDDAADEGLARARFAQEQHRGLGDGYFCHVLLHLEHGLALAHDVRAVVFLGDLVFEGGVFLLQGRLPVFHLFVQAQELGDERGHDGQEFRVGVELVLARKKAVDVEHSDGIAVE